MSKPKASDQTWRRIYHSQVAEVFESDTENDYYKVVLEGQRPKYFYGELAFRNYQHVVHEYEMKTIYSQDYGVYKRYESVVNQSMAKQYTINFTEVTDYQTTFVADSDEEALAMVRDGLWDSWETVVIDSEVIQDSIDVVDTTEVD